MASSEHLEKIRASFSQQAQSFESKRMNFSKQEYLHASIRGMEPRLEDEALEVACGTGPCPPLSTRSPVWMPPPPCSRWGGRRRKNSS